MQRGFGSRFVLLGEEDGESPNPGYCCAPSSTGRTRSEHVLAHSTAVGPSALLSPRLRQLLARA